MNKKLKYDKKIIHIRNVFLLGSVFSICIVGVIWFIQHYSRKVIIEVAKEGLISQSMAISQFRKIYSNEVVPRAAELGVNTIHNIKGKEKGIPLPATLTKMFGQVLSDDSKRSTRAYLYSKYPFPWRTLDSDPMDLFRAQAWDHLTKNPNGSFSRIEWIDNQKVLRYATADTMVESCVQCHNSHPQSPKTDWMVGDVRGILEVQKPIEKVLASADSGVLQITWMMGAVGVLGIAGLFGMAAMIRRLQSSEVGLTYQKKELEKILDEKESAENQLAEQRTKLEESMQMATMGELISGIAHEIRNPLAIINGNLEELRDEAEEKEQLDSKYVNQIAESLSKASDRIVAIVKGVQSSSRKSSTDPFVSTKIKKVIENVAVLVKNRSKRTKVNLYFPSVDENLEIECRESQIVQILLNLINNSIDAIKPLPKKWIHVNVSDLGNSVEISVTDSGHGIPAKVANDILKPFFTTKEKGKGTGLGLSISQTIAKSHRGYLTLNKDCANTCFVLGIPKKHIIQAQTNEIKREVA